MKRLTKLDQRISEALAMIDEQEEIELEQAVAEAGYELFTNDDESVTLLVQDDQFTGSVSEVKDVLESLVIEEYQATPSYVERIKNGKEEF